MARVSGLLRVAGFDRADTPRECWALRLMCKISAWQKRSPISADTAAFLDAVRKSMRDIRSSIGATTINPKLLTAAETLQYEGFLQR